MTREPSHASYGLNFTSLAHDCTDVTIGLSQLEPLDISFQKLNKLSKRMFGLAPGDHWSKARDMCFPIHTNTVDIRHPRLDEEMFSAITGPFKRSDKRTLGYQIPLTRPKPCCEVRYRSGHVGVLFSITRPFDFTAAHASETPKPYGGAVLGDRDLKSRARWIMRQVKKEERRKERQQEKRKQEVLADDEIGNLIEQYAEKAAGTMSTSSTLDSLSLKSAADDMIQRWQKQDEEKQLIYKSSSESSNNSQTKLHEDDTKRRGNVPKNRFSITSVLDDAFIDNTETHELDDYTTESARGRFFAIVTLYQLRKAMRLFIGKRRFQNKVNAIVHDRDQFATMKRIPQLAYLFRN